MNRMSKNDYYLDIALAVAQRSTCIKRRYGAVIVKDDRIVATGYNGAPRGMFNCSDRGKCTRLNKPHNTGDYSDCCSVHAEQNALMMASKEDLKGSTLYLAGEEVADGTIIKYCTPCPICARMIANSGIVAVKCIEGSLNMHAMVNGDMVILRDPEKEELVTSWV